VKNHRNHVVTIAATLIVMSCSTSCRAREAGAGDPQRPMFSPAAGSPIGIGCGPGTLAVGDMNKDGKPDLIVGCEQTRTLTVLLGTGDGAFRVSNSVSIADPPGNIAVEIGRAHV